MLRHIAVLVIVALVAISATARGWESSRDTFCALSTTREDSRISIEVKSGGYAYSRVDALVGSNLAAAYSVYINEALEKEGQIDPVDKSAFVQFRLTLPFGNVTLRIAVGQDEYVYYLNVLNRSYEAEIESQQPQQAPGLEFKFVDLVKVFASAWLGICVSLFSMWIWLRDKLKQDVKVLL